MKPKDFEYILSWKTMEKNRDNTPVTILEDNWMPKAAYELFSDMKLLSSKIPTHSGLEESHESLMLNSILY